MKKYSLLLLFAFLVITKMSSAQDLSFSQFYETPLLRNPALAGVFEGDTRIIGNYRNQWQSVTVPYKSGALSGEFKLPIGKNNDWITLGAQMAYDEAGDIKLKKISVQPVLNYHKSLSGDKDDYLSIAFMGGPVSSQFDPSQLKLDDQYQNGSYNQNNPTAQTFTKTNFSYWDASTGITYSGTAGEESHFFVGAGLFHLNTPKTNYYSSNKTSTIGKKFTLNTGFSTATSDDAKITFYADYSTQEGSELYMGGALYRMELLKAYDDQKTIELGMGAFYRWNDALVPVVRLDYYDLGIGLSYDINISKLNTASQSRGGFELSVSYRGLLNNSNNAANKVRCIGGF